jgi:hypothetical protein
MKNNQTTTRACHRLQTAVLTIGLAIGAPVVVAAPASAGTTEKYCATVRAAGIANKLRISIQPSDTIGVALGKIDSFRATLSRIKTAAPNASKPIVSDVVQALVAPRATLVKLGRNPGQAAKYRAQFTADLERFPIPFEAFTADVATRCGLQLTPVGQSPTQPTVPAVPTPLDPPPAISTPVATTASSAETVALDAWRFSVNAVDLNANAAVKAANTFNPTPDSGTQYVSVTVTASRATGDPIRSTDIVASVTTTDGQTIQNTLFAVGFNTALDISAPGGTYKLLFEVPPARLRGLTLNLQSVTTLNTVSLPLS